jgi:glycosyltransferase involved in cell wall biosynthesis
VWDQIVVGAAPGDAITKSAMLIRTALARHGESEIYAQHREPGLDSHVHGLDELPLRPNRERPLIFHASIGSWPVYRAITANERRLVLVYHNFSPAEYYADIAPEIAGDLIRGRWELEQLRDRVELAFADSSYNAEELEALGYTDVHVVAPTPDIDRLDRVVPDPEMLARIDSWGGGPVVLCVAQQLPHKRIERVLAAVAVLQQEHRPDARLAFVGVDRLETYSRSLRAMARAVGVREPQLLGRISDAELSALYVRASVFCTLSEHEGFCVPVVEAMATGVPVVAANRAAVPSTVGGAGVIVDDPDDPVFVAAVLDRVISDPDLRRELIGRGVHRAHSLSAPATLPQYVDTLLGHPRASRVTSELAAAGALGG